MTTQRPVNRITIIAALSTQREAIRTSKKERTFKEVDIRQEHTRSGASVDRMVLQLESPWGLPYALPVEANRSVIGGELLDERTSDGRRRLKIEGRMAMRRREDRRFVSNPLEEGRFTRELHVIVEKVSLPTEEEAQWYGARIELDATIVTPCRYQRNHDIGVRMITTMVQVSGMRHNSLVQGAYHRDSDTFNRVLVAIPEQHPNAAYLLHRGNRLHLTGDLEFVFEGISKDVVQTRLQEIDDTWEPQLQAATERNAPVPEVRRLWTRYRNERQRLAEQMRIRVAVLDMEPAPDAVPGTVAENREWYREQTKQRRSARRGQEQRSQHAPQQNGQHNDAPQHTGTVIVGDAEVDTAEPAPDDASVQPSDDRDPVKRRRRPLKSRAEGEPEHMTEGEPEHTTEGEPEHTTEGEPEDAPVPTQTVVDVAGATMPRTTPAGDEIEADDATEEA